MKYKLIKEINPHYTAIQQVLTNRGINNDEIDHYLNTTDADIRPPEMFNEDILRDAGRALIEAISKEKDAIVIVDCDCDGYTSAAILINYLYDLFPSWTLNHLRWYLHTGKQHGLEDCIDWILERDFSLVITPDSASNDFTCHRRIVEKGGKVIVLDHHDVTIPKGYKDAFIINNNAIYEDYNGYIYPNRALSGAAVTWQFCRYLDKVLKQDYANNYIDLAAIGDQGDMMDYREIETKRIIEKGLQRENLKNPLIVALAEKSQFKLGDGDITPMGASFYIVPFINAMVRSGTLEEKKILFESMIKFKSYEKVESTKRGHSFGELESLVTQAARIVTNVKNRQTKIVDKSLEVFDKIIKEKNLLDHKVLLILLTPQDDVPSEVRGLIANKFMAKYQRPVCVLTETSINGQSMYQGSARGCDEVGIFDFKQDCLDTNLIEYAVGHPGAFGLGIKKDNVSNFIKILDEKFKDMPSEPTYYVDFIYKGADVDSLDILQIASLENIYSTNMKESLVAIEGLKVTLNMVSVFQKKTNTLKITLPNGVSIMKFNVTEEELDKLPPDTGYIEVNIVGTCKKNVFMDMVTPQIFIEDIEIVDSNEYFF